MHKVLPRHCDDLLPGEIEKHVYDRRSLAIYLFICTGNYGRCHLVRSEFWKNDIEKLYKPSLEELAKKPNGAQWNKMIYGGRDSRACLSLNPLRQLYLTRFHDNLNMYSTILLPEVSGKLSPHLQLV